MASQAKKIAQDEKLALELTPDPSPMPTFKSELGSTRIHQAVVAKIAGLAVREVDGVHELVPWGTGQRISSLAHTLTGDEMRDLGVAVEVGEIEAAVDCRIVTEYGVSIPRVAAEIQRNVCERVEQMTGLKVKEINIEVVDLYFESDGKQRPAGEEPRVR